MRVRSLFVVILHMCVLWSLGHFRFTFASFSKRGVVLNHSYDTEFNLHVNEKL